MNDYRRGNFLTALPPVTRVILIINVAIFILIYFVQRTTGLRMDNFLALHNFKTNYFLANHQGGYMPVFFSPIQIITHMFMHGGLSHLFFNMFGLFLFGKVLESVLGSKNFFILYITSGLGAALLQLGINYVQLNSIGFDILQFYDNPTYSEFWRLINKLDFDTLLRKEYRSEIINLAQLWNDNPDNLSLIAGAKSYLHTVYSVYVNIPMVGASGAIMGVLAAFAVMFPNIELMIIFFPVPIKAKYLIPVFALASLFLGITNIALTNVAHFAHLGGGIVGFLLVLYWKKNKFKPIN